MTEKSTLPPIDDAYRKAIVAGAVFLVCMEVMYFWLSGVPSFAIPSKDALGETAIGRDFLNIWFGAKSAFEGGPAIFFDFWNYNLYLQSISRPPTCTITSGPIRRTSSWSSGRSA